jgi:hypothetical protein
MAAYGNESRHQAHGRKLFRSCIVLCTRGSTVPSSKEIDSRLELLLSILIAPLAGISLTLIVLSRVGSWYVQLRCLTLARAFSTN